MPAAIWCCCATRAWTAAPRSRGRLLTRTSFAFGALLFATGELSEADQRALFAAATTYALGHASRRYYGQNRSLTTSDLRSLFETLKEEAAGIFPRVETRIRDQARTLDLPAVMAKIRG